MKFTKYFLIIFSLIILFLVFTYWSFANKTLHISVLKTLFTKGEIRNIANQTNVLILGLPGATYDGPELTDTIIVVNYNFDTNRAVMIGIPRDIWSNALKDKINSAYVYGESVKKGGGLILAKAEVGSIIGVPIQYGLAVDFDDFKKIIDYLGGVNINVETGFIDNKYPIKGKENDDCSGDEEFKCRYETIKFKKGLNSMDSDQALKFIRSRNATSSEGNDFARIKRQQLVINSIQSEIFKKIGILNLNKLKDFYITIDKLIERDLSNQQASIIIKNILLKRNFKLDKITIPNELFFSPEYSSYDGRYVLIPINDDYSDIHKYIEKSLN